jgi:hypothetical protein
MQYHAALDHGKAMVALMTGAFTAVPVVTLARALVEVAGQAWWLLEPGIGHVGRLERPQILRYRMSTAVHLTDALSSILIPENPCRSGCCGGLRGGG